jgi:hypothetical protein
VKNTINVNASYAALEAGPIDYKPKNAEGRA